MSDRRSLFLPGLTCLLLIFFASLYFDSEYGPRSQQSAPFEADHDTTQSSHRISGDSSEADISGPLSSETASLQPTGKTDVSQLASSQKRTASGTDAEGGNEGDSAAHLSQFDEPPDQPVGTGADIIAAQTVDPDARAVVHSLDASASSLRPVNDSGAMQAVTASTAMHAAARSAAMRVNYSGTAISLSQSMASLTRLMRSGPNSTAAFVRNSMDHLSNLMSTLHSSSAGFVQRHMTALAQLRPDWLKVKQQAHLSLQKSQRQVHLILQNSWRPWIGWTAIALVLAGLSSWYVRAWAMRHSAAMLSHPQAETMALGPDPEAPPSPEKDAELKQAELRAREMTQQLQATRQKCADLEEAARVKALAFQKLEADFEAERELQGHSSEECARQLKLRKLAEQERDSLKNEFNAQELRMTYAIDEAVTEAKMDWIQSDDFTDAAREHLLEQGAMVMSQAEFQGQLDEASEEGYQAGNADNSTTTVRLMASSLESDTSVQAELLKLRQELVQVKASAAEQSQQAKDVQEKLEKRVLELKEALRHQQVDSWAFEKQVYAIKQENETLKARHGTPE
ncbi:hypothetical protein WJX73_008751 [Symbiochloris irregularis]|uniref:Transmembrane protein n=1 Tax=Symbiochloris irregularis TaxID=706552 RepID=A0AAW1NVP9_9CHLO